jgi:hypothetical protein
MAEEVKATEEFTGEVDAGDCQTFGQDDGGVEVGDIPEEAGDNADNGKEDDMIEIDTVGADDDKGEKTAASTTPAKTPQGDAEADEHDLIMMPVKHVVLNDLGELNRKKRLIVRTLTADDLLNQILHDVIRSKACCGFSLDYVTSSDEEGSKIGIMTVTFTTAKQTSQAMASIQAIREDLAIECVPVTDSANAVVDKWKKENAGSSQLTGPMLIVKNLDPASATVEKLAEIFPDAEDIAISSQPQANNLGKLKGTKYAYLLYPDLDQATAALEAFKENPVQLDGRDLIVGHYKEPPNHIPEGYLVLTTRKLVLRQIARAKGLMVRCQEDPTYEMAEIWPQRLQKATEMIEKDDAARDLLGLPKPTLQEFKDMLNLKQLNPSQSDQILSKFELADTPSGTVPRSGGGDRGSFTGKRPYPAPNNDSREAKRAERGGQQRGGYRGRGGSSPQINNRGGRGSNGRNFGSGFSSQGGRGALMGAPSRAGMMFGMMQPQLPHLISPQGMYGSVTPGPGNFPIQQAPPMSYGGGPMRGPQRGGSRGYGRPY